MLQLKTLLIAVFCQELGHTRLGINSLMQRGIEAESVYSVSTQEDSKQRHQYLGKNQDLINYSNSHALTKALGISRTLCTNT